MKLCHEGALSTPYHNVLTKVLNDEVKKVSTAVSSLQISGKGLP